MEKVAAGGECLSITYILTAIPRYELQLLIKEIDRIREEKWRPVLVSWAHFWGFHPKPWWLLE
jgi:hypothetical protein